MRGDVNNNKPLGSISSLLPANSYIPLYIKKQWIMKLYKAVACNKSCFNVLMLMQYAFNLSFKIEDNCIYSYNFRLMESFYKLLDPFFLKNSENTSWENYKNVSCFSINAFK